MKLVRLVAALFAFTLIVAACGNDDEGSADDSSEESSSGATDSDSSDDSESDDAESDDAGSGDDGSGDADADDAASADDMGDSITLNLGHPFPAQHPIQVGALEGWAADVNEATAGTVSVEFFAGGALGGPPTVYDNTVSGAQDLGWALQGYTSGRFPATDVIEMPFTFETATQATEVLWDLYEEFPAVQDEYADVKLLGLWVHDLGNLWIAGGKVESIEDVNGLTLRAPSPVQNSVISALGGDPVGLPAPELFDSLERGVIDGLFIADSGLTSFNLFEVLDSGVRCNCYVAAQFLTMNLDQWNGLSPAQQAAIDGLSGRTLSLKAAEVYDAAHESASSSVEEAGIELTVLDDAALEAWKATTQSVVDGWIADNEGSFPSGDLYGRMIELVEG